MIRCQHCACVVAPGNICHGCGKIVLATDQEVDAARKELTARLQKFEGRKNDAETREEFAQTIEAFGGIVSTVGPGVEFCRCGGDLEATTFQFGATLMICKKCGALLILTASLPTAVFLDMPATSMPIVREAMMLSTADFRKANPDAIEFCTLERSFADVWKTCPTCNGETSRDPLGLVVRVCCRNPKCKDFKQWKTLCLLRGGNQPACSDETTSESSHNWQWDSEFPGASLICTRCSRERNICVAEDDEPPCKPKSDRANIPPTRTDEGFDLLGQVGRVRRKTR